MYEYYCTQSWYFDHDAPLDRIEGPVLVAYVYTPLKDLVIR